MLGPLVRRTKGELLQEFTDKLKNINDQARLHGTLRQCLAVAHFTHHVAQDPKCHMLGPYLDTLEALPSRPTTLSSRFIGTPLEKPIA